MTPARHAAANVENNAAKETKSGHAVDGNLPIPGEDKIMSDYDARMCDLIRKAALPTLPTKSSRARCFHKAGKSPLDYLESQSMGLEYIKLTPTRKPRENTPTKAAYLARFARRWHCQNAKAI